MSFESSVGFRLSVKGSNLNDCSESRLTIREEPFYKAVEEEKGELGDLTPLMPEDGI